MTDPTSPANPRHLIGRRGLIIGGAAVALAACSGASEAPVAAPATAGSSPARPGTTSAEHPPAAAGSTAVPSTAVPSTAQAGCTLSPELTAGPYHLDGHLNRRDITEGKPGVPLEFGVRVLSARDCTPLVGAAVDVWHCDAGGEYSGFNGNSLAATQAQGTNDQRFLRGVQLTGPDGTATFTTIFPGWYEGRAVHIHLQVLEGGQLKSTYQGGHIAHVGQAFFEEAITDQLMERDPYRAHTGMRTTNEQDSIFAQAGPNAVTPLHPDGAGYRAVFTCIVDPTATPPPAPLF